jgi:uncharacterized protein (DUF1697 family)
VKPARIALLRGVNVGGHSQVAMTDLRAMVIGLGLAEPRTLLQSGNLVFRSDAPAEALEHKLEDATAERFGFKVTYFVRDAAQWSGIIAANPFPDEAKADPGHLLVQFLRTAPDAAAVAALQAAIGGPEIVRAHGRHAYIIYPDGIGRSRLTGPMVEAKLGLATGRNWNTVLKLAALAGV